MKAEEFDFEAAERAGIDLAYQPEVICPDIAQLTIDEWKEMRTKGIGGSEAGTAMGIGNGLTQLILKKTGRYVEQPADRKTQFRFDYGHSMEPVLGNYFAGITGFRVFEDRRMFRHPQFQWMIADVDGFAYDLDGTKVGLEFKTSGDIMKSSWVSGIYGQDGLVGRPEYIWQVRHYMVVLNIWRFYIICGFGNNPDDVRIVRVDRDFQSERQLIDREKEVWHYTETGEVPVLPSYTRAEFDAVKDSFTPDAACSISIELPESMKDTLNTYMDLSSQKTALQAKIREIEAKQNGLRIPLINALGSAQTATLKDGEKVYSISYKPTVKETADKEKLLTDYPEVWKEVRQTSETRTLRISSRKAGKTK